MAVIPDLVVLDLEAAKPTAIGSILIAGILCDLGVSAVRKRVYRRASFAEATEAKGAEDAEGGCFKRRKSQAENRRKSLRSRRLSGKKMGLPQRRRGRRGIFGIIQDDPSYAIFECRHIEVNQ